VKLPKHRAVNSPRLQALAMAPFSAGTAGLAEAMAENKRVKRTVWVMPHCMLTVEFGLLEES
jgi:hypothetical protein